MQELRLVAVNDVGTHLVLTGPDGRDYLLRLDERLHAAIRRDLARLSQLDIAQEPALRPREIQARIRGGQSVADVAEAAAVPMVRIERFAGPVLAERAHVAQAAQRSAVRRRSDGPDAPLGELVLQHLAGRGLGEDDLSWDAWRRDDGRWSVRLDYDLDGGPHSATWVYDPLVRVVSCDDDDSHRLIDDRVADHRQTPTPHLIGLPRPGESERTQAAETFPAIGTDGTGDLARPTEGAGGAPAAHPVTPPPAPAATAPVVEPEAAPEVPDQPAASAARTARTSQRAARTGGDRSGKRASVPSWDEIVFGRRRPAAEQP